MSDFPQDQHDDMVNNQRYGKLTIQYEAGKVTAVRREEVIAGRHLEEKKRLTNNIRK